jgi:hypothetical protein
MSVAHSAEELRQPQLATVQTSGHRPHCESCGAALDDQQRYCVHCGARRPDIEEPAIAWMAARKARAVAAPTAPASPPRNPLALPAILLLLLPVVAAVGVIAGRGGSDPVDPRLLQALRSQKAPIVKVGDVAGGTATTAATRASGKTPKAGKRDSSGGKVLAKTRYGVAHQISGFKPTKAKVESDRKLVQQINKSIGKDYLQAQKNLPDTIVVPTGTGGNSQGAQGRGD